MRKSTSIFAALAASLTTSACMFAPFNGETVPDRLSLIDFEGSDYQATRDIEIQAYNYSALQYQQITDVNPGNTPYSFDGSNWYLWQTRRRLSTSYWKAGSKGGHVARVRAIREASNGTATGGSMISVEPDWRACASRYGDRVGNFVSYCRSPLYPEALVYTSAYPGTVDFVNTAMGFSPSGTTVVVENAGRTGRLTRIECSGAGRTIVSTQNQIVKATETAQFRVSIVPSPGETIRCTVKGTELDGTPEPVVCLPNPQGTIDCGDNTRSRTL